MKYLLIMGFVIGLFVSFGAASGMWVPQTPQDLWDQSQIVFVGNITGITKLEIEKSLSYATEENGVLKQMTENYTLNLDEYDVKIEQYLKNPQNFDTIKLRQPTVSAAGYLSTVGGFEIGNSVLFYVSKIDNQTEYSPESFKIQESCNAQDLATQKRSMAGVFEISQGDKKPPEQFVAGKAIHYKITTPGLELGNDQINYVIKFLKKQDSNYQTVFEKNIALQPSTCSWNQILEWDFVPPSSGQYVYEISSSKFNDLVAGSGSFIVGKETRQKNESDSTHFVYPIKHKQYEYFIPYTISDAKIDKITIDCASASLIIYLSDSVTQGQITLSIPRKLIDAKVQGQDNDFIILVDGKETDFKEITSDLDSRTLQIQIPKSSTIIEILASNVGQFPESMICGMADTNNLPYFRLLSPLQQFKSGLAPADVVCRSDLVLVMKMTDNSPACVKPEHSERLLSDGWFSVHSSYGAKRPLVTVIESNKDLGIGLTEMQVMSKQSYDTFHEGNLKISAFQGVLSKTPTVISKITNVSNQTIVLNQVLITGSIILSPGSTATIMYADAIGCSVSHLEDGKTTCPYPSAIYDPVQLSPNESFVSYFSDDFTHKLGPINKITVSIWYGMGVDAQQYRTEIDYALHIENEN